MIAPQPRIRPLWLRAPRLAWRIGAGAVSTGLALAIVVGVAVQVIQDRWVWLALLFYVPLWPIGAAAVGWDLLRVGRALRPRWLLLCLGLATALLGVGGQWSPARAPEPAGVGPAVKLLHWNVRWGGLRGPDSLRAIIAEVRSHDADVILLSELPPEQWFLFEWRNSGPEMFHAVAGRGPSPDGYWYRIGLISRWPVQLSREWDLPDGKAALFEVTVSEDRRMRLLAVDLESSPRIHRAPSLRAIAAIADALAREGRAVDVIAGDFNSPARAYGFSTIEATHPGYRRAALWSGQWRATWPTRLPVLDIDHILVRRGMSIGECLIFTNRASDHRGQVASIHTNP